MRLVIREAGLQMISRKGEKMDGQDRKERDHGGRFAKVGVDRAFEQRWRLYKERIWYFICAKQIAREDARDILQIVAIKLYRYLGVNNPDNVLPIAFKIARDEIVDYLRKLHRIPELASLDELIAFNLEPAVSSLENNALEASHLQSVMKRCKLDPKQQTALVLHILVGYTVKEVAVITETPVETVRSRLRLAKEKMRIVLTKEGRR